MNQINELDQFIDRISVVLPQVIREANRRQRHPFARGDMTQPQQFILEVLEQRGQLYMSDLATALGVSRGAVTGMVNRLLSRKLVKRERDQLDRRKVHVTMTTKGQSLINQVRDQRNQVLRDAFGRLSAHERTQYITILTKIRDIFTERAAGS